MLHQPPSSTTFYNGLTIVLSQPSRFDLLNKRLLTSSGGYFFEKECLEKNGINILACDVRLKEMKDNLLEGTKAVLLLGEEAMHEWCPNTKENTLGELRGSPLKTINNLPAIASWLPQDCKDISNHEARLNPLLYEIEESESDDDRATAVSEKRRHGKTSRKNYAFWLQRDVSKVGRLLVSSVSILRERLPTYKIYPPLEEVVSILTTTKGGTLYFDIETDSLLNITCFSFAFSKEVIYIVPVQRYNYTWAYDRLPSIFKALAIGIRDNTLVAHNGACFDFFVLGHKYKIAIGESVYDTMIAMHRCFPEVERSLGHCTSTWTWQPFHKDEGSFAYGSQIQEQNLWKYCGKDTFTMILIKEAIDKYAKTIPGLEDSIKQAMGSIRPYLITTFLGIKFDNDLRQSIIRENDRYCNELIRIAEFLIGSANIKPLRKLSKKPMMNSNAQCCRYFHDMLGYKVVARSKKTNNPSLGKKNLYKLKLRVDNPMIDVCIAYRETLKETGSLKFNAWRQDDFPY